MVNHREISINVFNHRKRLFYNARHLYRCTRKHKNVYLRTTIHTGKKCKVKIAFIWILTHTTVSTTDFQKVRTALCSIMNSDIWESWSIAFILLKNGNTLYSKQSWTHENIAQGFYLSTIYISHHFTPVKDRNSSRKVCRLSLELITN